MSENTKVEKPLTEIVKDRYLELRDSLEKNKIKSTDGSGIASKLNWVFDFRDDPYKRANIEVLEKGCDKCGGDVYCGFIDLGMGDRYNNYFHICSKCDSVKHHEEVIRNGMESEHDLQDCPFCTGLFKD